MEKNWRMNTGAQPVADDVTVEVLLSNGFEMVNKASHFDWRIDIFGGFYDVAVVNPSSYRICSYSTDVYLWRLADTDSEVTK